MTANGRPSMYSAFNHETQELYPEYVETRSTTAEGWLRMFHNCYPDKARGVRMWKARFTPEGAEILDYKGEVIVTFKRVP